MNVIEFQQRWGGEYQKFIGSQMGKDFLEAIESLRMSPACDHNPHQIAYRLGAIAGYEECIFKISQLAILQKTVVEPKMNYGVKTPEPEKKKAE